MIRQLGWACVVYGVVGTACDSGSLPNADDAGFDTDWDGGYGDAADAKADTDDDRKNACLEEGYAYHDKTSTCYVPDSVDYQVWSPGDLAASPYVEFCGALNAYDARCKEAWTPCNVLGGDTILCRYLYDELDYRLCLGAPRPEGWGPDEDDNLIDWPSDDLRWPPSYDDPPAWAPYRHWRASFRTAVTDCLESASCDSFESKLGTCMDTAAAAAGQDSPGLADDPFVVECAEYAPERVCRRIRVSYTDESLELATRCLDTPASDLVFAANCLYAPTVCTGEYWYNAFCTADSDF